MEKNTKEHWVETLKRWDSEGSDFGQVSDLAGYNNNNTEPSYCALGVLMDMAKRNQPKYKPTFHQRIRNRVSDFRYWLASKIVGYDIRDSYNYYD